MKKVAQKQTKRLQSLAPAQGEGLPAFPIDIRRDAVLAALRHELAREDEDSRDYRCLSNERGAGPLRELPIGALVARAVGADTDGDLVDSILEEVEIRTETLIAVAHAGGSGATVAERVESELCMLLRRTEVARELLRRCGGVGDVDRIRDRIERLTQPPAPSVRKVVA